MTSHESEHIRVFFPWDGRDETKTAHEWGELDREVIAVERQHPVGVLCLPVGKILRLNLYCMDQTIEHGEQYVSVSEIEATL